jgi:hypothetical protein
VTLANDHACSLSNWDRLANCLSAIRIVIELFAASGARSPVWGDGLEIYEEALRALFLRHLIKEHEWNRSDAAQAVGMREDVVKDWLVWMKRGPELFRLRKLTPREKAAAAVVERRMPHLEERARMEAEWRSLLDYNGIADEANLPIALQYQFLQDYYERASVRMSDRETRAFLANRLDRPVSSLDVLPQDLASLVESGRFITADLSFWNTTEKFHVPVLKVMGGNPLRLLLVVICREGAADVERAIRMVVRIYGKPDAFIHDDARRHSARFVMRACAALHIRNLSVPASVGARWEGLIAHIKDAGPQPEYLSIVEVPELLAMLELRLAPRVEKLPFAALSEDDRSQLRLSKRSVVPAKADGLRYLNRHLQGLGGALDGQPIQVAVMGEGIVAVHETYGVVKDEGGRWVKPGPGPGSSILATSGADTDMDDLPTTLTFDAEVQRLEDELTRVLPPELGGTFKRRRQKRRPRRPKLPPFNTAAPGPAGPGGGGHPGGTGGGGSGGGRPTRGTDPAVGGGLGGGGINGDDPKGGQAKCDPSGGQPTVVGGEGTDRPLREVPPAASMSQVVRLDHPQADDLIRQSGGDPALYRELQTRGMFVALAPYAKGNPYEIALALSLDPNFTYTVKIVILVHHGELSYYCDESIIADSRTAHSGIRPTRAHLSAQLSELMASLNSDLLEAASIVEDRQRCRELIGDVLPQLDELAHEGGLIADKLRNVRAHVERADSFLLGGDLTRAEGALIHAAFLMPVRRAV